jgi:hypothetical protein
MLGSHWLIPQGTELLSHAVGKADGSPAATMTIMTMMLVILDFGETDKNRPVITLS